MSGVTASAIIDNGFQSEIQTPLSSAPPPAPSDSQAAAPAVTVDFSRSAQDVLARSNAVLAVLGGTALSLHGLESVQPPATEKVQAPSAVQDVSAAGLQGDEAGELLEQQDQAELASFQTELMEGMLRIEAPTGGSGPGLTISLAPGTEMAAWGTTKVAAAAAGNGAYTMGINIPGIGPQIVSWGRPEAPATPPAASSPAGPAP